MVWESTPIGNLTSSNFLVYGTMSEVLCHGQLCVESCGKKQSVLKIMKCGFVCVGAISVDDGEEYVVW